MKKVVSVIAIAMLTVMLCMSLTACGALSGTYTASGLLGDSTYTFSGNNCTYEYKVGGLTYTSKSTYTVGKDENGNKTITFTKVEGNENDTTKYDTAYSLNEGKDDKGTYIEIGGVKYYKK